MNKLLRLVAEHIIAQDEYEHAKELFEIESNNYWGKENSKYGMYSRADYENSKYNFVVAAEKKRKLVKAIKDELCKDSS